MATPSFARVGETSLYPTKCPQCDAMQARAVRIAAPGGQATQFEIDMYCVSCAHRWQMFIPAAKPNQ
jgi:hypothetical protein